MLRYGFNRLYKELLKVYSEDNVAGAGGVFGDAGSMGFGGAVPGGEDFYAPGDARTVFNGGTTSRFGKVDTKNDKKKKKKKKKKKRASK